MSTTPRRTRTETQNAPISLYPPSWLQNLSPPTTILARPILHCWIASTAIRWNVQRLSKMRQLQLFSRHYLLLSSRANVTTFSLPEASCNCTDFRSDLCTTSLRQTHLQPHLQLPSPPPHTYLKPPLTPTSPPSPLNKYLILLPHPQRHLTPPTPLPPHRHPKSPSLRIPLHPPHKPIAPHLNHPPQKTL